MLESAGRKMHIKVLGQAFYGYMTGLDVGESFGSTPKEKVGLTRNIYVFGSITLYYIRLFVCHCEFGHSLNQLKVNTI